MIGRAATSSSLKHQWTYDVFINFRGEDTRNGFTGNLYHALTQKGVSTFIDDKELKKGDEITPTLLKAIENSRMAITVFSKNYASSTFCLNELVKIHQCIKGRDRLVWPIFYDVEPSEVRHQKGSYEQALTMHKNNFKADEQMIQSWKLALHDVANISGLHVNPRHGYEYHIIERIVKEISSKTNRIPLHVAEYPVGLELRVLKINSILEIWSNDKVYMIGICGIGGMGKTTIARAVYNLVADNFEGLCFLYDIKENSRKLGLERIQERILSKILGVDIKVEDVNEGVEIIKMRLKQKKVLLILDNVDKHEQLKKLAGDCNWFGAGSRIIITTRDKHLLARHGVERKYDMEAFNSKESLELLSWNAFRNDQVNPSHVKILNRAIDYAQGLPLALEVIGSQLFGMSINEWESTLDIYKKIPNEDIQQVLKVSYDGLEQGEKEIFLDIACFFKGEDVEYVKDMVKHVHDLNASYSIRVLVNKCLIKIEEDNIKMHDLIQDMGREIVRQESPKRPGNRSRLWFHQDIIHVLEENTGTNEVSIMMQDNLLDNIKVNWDGEAFKNMKNLKILIFENVKFSESPKYLPNSLKVLKWKGYPSSCLPLHFGPKKLVVFELTHSCLRSLETIKELENLSVLKLRGCQYIEQIPNLSCLHDLKELDLRYCKSLIEIHNSIGYLAKLRCLDVRDCAQLEIFPPFIKLPSLDTFLLSNCPSLKYFPEILEDMKIRDLQFFGTGIEKLPLSICKITQLKWLDIKSDRAVINVPRSIFLLPKIQYINVQCSAKWLSSNPKNEALVLANWSKITPNKGIIYLQRCNISDELLRAHLNWFIKVQKLDLTGSNFTILPMWIKECELLRNLVLNECRHLREVEGIPPNIECLEAVNCISLSSKSRSLLLSEELFEARVIRHYSNIPKTHICVPTASIPDWFDHRSKGASISFWYRSYFPPLYLCALFRSREGVLEQNDHFYSMAISVRINRTIYDHNLWVGVTPNVDHIIMYTLEKEYYHWLTIKNKEHCIPGNKMQGACRKSKWDHVTVRAYVQWEDIRSTDPWMEDSGFIDPYEMEDIRLTDLVIEKSGIYVIKQLYEMEDIRFTDPYERLDIISGTKGCQQQNNVASVNVEKIPNGFEDNIKAKGKEIVVYNDKINKK